MRARAGRRALIDRPDATPSVWNDRRIRRRREFFDEKNQRGSVARAGARNGCYAVRIERADETSNRVPRMLKIGRISGRVRIFVVANVENANSTVMVVADERII